MVLLGCKPAGRHTEQHDIFFGIATELAELKPQINAFWPETEGKMHIDAWREVNYVDNYLIRIGSPDLFQTAEATDKLFFLNLGGYRENEFEEYHYKLLTVASNTAAAIQTAKQTVFYKHYDLKHAPSHIDDKYGIDVDDIYNVQDILPAAIKMNYRIETIPVDSPREDEIHLGYLKLSKL